MTSNSRLAVESIPRFEAASLVVLPVVRTAESYFPSKAKGQRLAWLCSFEMRIITRDK